jgi:hypothetical protein
MTVGCFTKCSYSFSNSLIESRFFLIARSFLRTGGGWVIPSPHPYLNMTVWLSESSHVFPFRKALVGVVMSMCRFFATVLLAIQCSLRSAKQNGVDRRALVFWYSFNSLKFQYWRNRTSWRKDKRFASYLGGRRFMWRVSGPSWDSRPFQANVTNLLHGAESLRSRQLCSYSGTKFHHRVHKSPPLVPPGKCSSSSLMELSPW